MGEIACICILSCYRLAFWEVGCIFVCDLMLGSLPKNVFVFHWHFYLLWRYVSIHSDEGLMLKISALYFCGPYQLFWYQIFVLSASLPNWQSTTFSSETKSFIILSGIAIMKSMLSHKSNCMYILVVPS